MPIYEYECGSCRQHLERMQALNEAPLETCPFCQQGRLQKIISPAGFRLKGSGWYETDFKNTNQKNLSRDESLDQPSKNAKEALAPNKESQS